MNENLKIALKSFVDFNKGVADVDRACETFIRMWNERHPDDPIDVDTELDYLRWVWNF